MTRALLGLGDLTQTVEFLMRFLGQWVVRQARWIVLAWALLGLIGGILAPQALQRLTGGGGELPGSESAAVDRVLNEHFATPLASRLLVVLETKAQAVDAPAGVPAARWTRWIDTAGPTRKRA